MLYKLVGMRLLCPQAASDAEGARSMRRWIANPRALEMEREYLASQGVTPPLALSLALSNIYDQEVAKRKKGTD